MAEDAEGGEKLTAEQMEALQAMEDQIAEEFEDEAMPEVEIGLGAIVVGFFVFFGILMFGGIYESIFVILACATAFRVGMTGVMDND